MVKICWNLLIGEQNEQKYDIFGFNCFSSIFFLILLSRAGYCAKKWKPAYIFLLIINLMFFFRIFSMNSIKTGKIHRKPENFREKKVSFD